MSAQDSGGQSEIWERHTEGVTADDVVEAYRNPYPFQREFSSYMNSVLVPTEVGTKLRVCEMGCEFGVTSLLLDDLKYERHCLDLNPRALSILNAAAKQLGKTVHLHQQDMFETAFEEKSFDVVFNNGVLEHYTLAERVRALKECGRIVRPGGMVIIGVPNHFSIPYRIAYFLRVALGKWHYPPEFAIRNLDRELSEIDELLPNQILFFDSTSIYGLLPFARISSVPFKLLDRVFHFEPYLRVIECRRA